MDAIRISWPGGEHAFCLPLGRLRALQTACDAGPEEIFNRLRLGQWRVDEIIHTLRHGLIGGGMSEPEAATLVTSLIDLHPLAEFKLPAIAVLAHALLGDLDDELGKPETESSAPENGGSPKSMEPGQ